MVSEDSCKRNREQGKARSEKEQRKCGCASEQAANKNGGNEEKQGMPQENQDKLGEIE